MLESEYYLWGAGLYGERIIDFMKDDLSFKAVIDNNPDKQGTFFKGLPVFSYDEIKQTLPTIKIVLAMNIPTTVRTFLLSERFEDNKDIFVIHDFFPRFYWAKNRSIVIKSLDVPVTTMCNMRCKGCQVFMPMAGTLRHFTVEQITKNIDLAFNHIDSTMILNFAVGENLLNKELSDICTYISGNYSSRYGYLTVQTNGSIIPEDDALQRFSESKTIFGISNYPENAKTTKQLIERFDAFSVKWYYNSLGGTRESWIDYGDPRVIKESNHYRLRELYNKCFIPGMAVHDGYLYICSEQAWSLLVAEEGTLEAGDAFDLHQPRTKNSREELSKYVTRQPEKGYITHCSRCNSTMVSLSHS